MRLTIGSSRRKFLGECVAGLAYCGAAHALSRFSVLSTDKSRVVIAKDALLRGGGSSPDSGRLLKLLDRSMQAAYSSDTPLEAWKKVVRPGEVVGLKVNCLAGRGMSTNVVLVECICERLREAGVPQKNIVIWDRLSEDLESAGFGVASRQDRTRCIGNDALGYEEDLAIWGTVGSRLSKTLTQVCDVVINLPVLKDHGIAGVTIALKNMFGAIHNPNKYHPNVGNPYVADVNMFPAIRSKVRLHICDATTAQYEGGPTFMPQWTWPYNGLLLSTDPVALDAIGWQILEQKRAEKGLKPLSALNRAPIYIATAADAQHRLGTDNLKQIEQLEV
ncbi:MAG TPA: DUF362 domain-containing protein [Candidatus Saccharimonadales bacterium]|nr:DUF362 domain-containing protein [Candidatus Saccharimonadales bacterium]